ncbi:hypothetical protein CRE_06074 [Caenorhabditis remanei]|uniref:Uncharacterized protein n=1 Tax=Caenorhabditis remanei TaxID=31234 RepID=E3NB05_CAERE|nr:hypothetical protein CRE_06074 [Caenorhabditis remanei]
MPLETFDPIPVAYQNIQGVPIYMNFEYKSNWVTLITIIDLLLNIIGILIFIRIPIFYFKNKQKIKNIGLRLDVFQSFLLMQIWSIGMTIGEFLLLKIPVTGIFTNYCANNNAQVLLRFKVFFFHWAHYSSLLFTLLFCILRVTILYSNSNKEKEKLFYYLIPPFISFPFLASVPHLLTEGLCLQMVQPYPFGALIISSRFFEEHVALSAICNFLLTAIVTFTIIGMNIAMFWKIRERKKLSVAGQSHSTQNQKVARTLTGTMIVIIIPLIGYLIVATADIIPSDYLSYILYLGAIAHDIRVHIATCYFYFTHPVFKKHGMTRKRAMPPETFDPIAFAYQNIRDVPFYMNFEYKSNWVTLVTIIDLLLNIIGTLIFIRIPIFYFKNKQKIKNIGLRLDVFQSFLVMQILGIGMTIGEFIMFKIPVTGIFTNYCANNNPQVLLRFTVFFFHWAHYSSLLFTLLFCILRVTILYSNYNKEKEKVSNLHAHATQPHRCILNKLKYLEIQLFYYLISPFIIFPFLASLPHLLSEGRCLQMDQQYPFGALIIISKIFDENTVRFENSYYSKMLLQVLCAFGNFLLTAIVTFTIIGLNIAMFFKISERKYLSAAIQSQSSQNQKVARTLTGTMIVILIPLIVYLFVATAEIIPNDYLSYVLYCGAIAHDIRVHIVTCYFYFTHPVFKKHGMINKIDAAQKVTSQSEHF